jgi:hypothetical protein
MDEHDRVGANGATDVLVRAELIRAESRTRVRSEEEVVAREL